MSDLRQPPYSSLIKTLGMIMLASAVTGCSLYYHLLADDSFNQAVQLRDLGNEAYRKQHYAEALDNYRQAVELSDTAETPEFNSDLYYKIGHTHLRLQEYEKASQAFKQGLQQFDSAHENELAILHNMLGISYRKLGLVDKAREHFQKALVFRRKVGDTLGEARTLGNLAVTYIIQGRYAIALDTYRQAQQLFSGLPNAPVHDIGTCLSNIGSVYAEMGQYDKALQYQQQALDMFQPANEQADIASVYHNIGYIYSEQHNYAAAIKAFEQAIDIRETLGDRFGVAETRNNLGLTLSDQQKHKEALDVLFSALPVLRELNTRKPLAGTYDSIGTVYTRLGDYAAAFNAYLQALAIWRETGDRDNTRITLGNVGSLFEKKGEDTLAIVFYKESVNLSEQIRNDLRVMPEQDQKAYMARVQDFYRSLADLLLRQNRVIEAQKVLDLLKVQEASDFLGPVRGNKDTSQGVPQLPPEQKILQSSAVLPQQAIETGMELAALRKLDRSKWSPEQKRHWQELNNRERNIQRAFVTFIESEEIRTLVDQLSREVRTQMPALEQLRPLKDNLTRLGHGVVLLYPLVLEDRLELVLVNALSPPLHVPVPVSHQELNRTVLAFRTALTQRQENVKQPAQALYQWLVKPIEEHLDKIGAETILYAPDGVLRYVPLAALHDGRQWLVRKYKTNNITAFSLTELETRPISEPKLLAAAFANGDYDFTLGDQHFDFKGLPFAGEEVNNLTKLYPGALKLIDKKFNPDTVVPELDSFNIIHFATHAALVSGKPHESFILFGNGERVTVDQVKYEWLLGNVDLIALSACETALGSILGKGEEILGLGFLMESAGARATLASLWSVDDGGTQFLMNAFYRMLKQSNISKAEALRKAQLAMIDGNLNTQSGDGRGIGVVNEHGTVSFSHPYYWAPFILIGNGL